MEAAGAGSEVLQEAGGDSFEDDVWLNVSPYQMELTRQSDRLFSVRIPQEKLKDHSRKQDIETGMRMNEQGDLYRVSFFSYSLKPPITFVLCRKDSFAQSDTTLSWKIRTEAYTDPNVPMLSRTRNHQYLVTMTHIEVFYTPPPFSKYL